MFRRRRLLRPLTLLSSHHSHKNPTAQHSANRRRPHHHAYRYSNPSQLSHSLHLQSDATPTPKAARHNQSIAPPNSRSSPFKAAHLRYSVSAHLYAITPSSNQTPNYNGTEPIWPK